MRLLAWWLISVGACATTAEEVDEVDALEELGGAGMEFLTCREEPGTWCGEAFADAKKRGLNTAGFQSADRLVRLALEIAGDEMCQTGSVNAASEDFLEEAVALFRRCHMVVIRNATNREYMLDYKRRFDEYVAMLKNGTIEGITTHGEKFFLKSIGDKRWLLLLPEEFGTPELLAPFWLRRDSRPRLLRTALGTGRDAWGGGRG